MARIVDVILHDQGSVLTVCSRILGMEGLPEVTISIPHLLGGDGVIASVPLDLAIDESVALKQSAGIISNAIDSLGRITI
nr:hypothetical protein [Novipirellula galeiformis]